MYIFVSIAIKKSIEKWNVITKKIKITFIKTITELMEKKITHGLVFETDVVVKVHYAFSNINQLIRLYATLVSFPFIKPLNKENFRRLFFV
jgi:hypothetical protein